MTRRISRRTFFKTGAAVAATAVLSGCQGARRWVNLEPYVRAPEDQLDGVATWYASACRQCSSGCGIIVRVMNGRALKIEGNPEHPLNRGKLCAAGQAGLQLLYHPDRVLLPRQTAQRGTGPYAQVPWDAAIGVLSQKLQQAGNAVAVWGGMGLSGHVYDLLQRLTKAVGAPTGPVIYDLRSAWNGQAALAGATNQLFGQGVLPGYAIGDADVVFSFGADFLGTWLSPVRYGLEFGRFRTQANGLRGYLVQVEPRMSITGAKADRWVACRPGTEGQVAQAMARIIADDKLGPADWAGRAAAVAGSVDVNAVAQAADVTVDELRRLARIFAGGQRPVAIAGNNLGGAGDLAAAQALNVIAGSRSLALSANLPVPDVVRPVPSTFADAQALIGRMQAGQVKALIVAGANPAWELPDKAGFMAALKNVPFVATFTPIMDEMANNSDLVLAERTYLESWGYSVAWPNFGMPSVTLQQPVVAPRGDSRSAADVLLAAAKGISAAASTMNFPDEVTFLRSTLSKLPEGAAGGGSADVVWTRLLQHGGWWPGQAPAPTQATGTAAAVTLTPAQPQGDANQYPYYLYVYLPTLLAAGNTASLPWLQGSPDPLTSISWQTWVEINPVTAQKLGVQKGDVVRVTTPNGQLEAPVYVYPTIRQDTIAVPLGQGHTAGGRYAAGKGAAAQQLLGAQPGAGGSDPNWAVQRASVVRTGRTVRMATFEWTPGVTQGFDNAGFPGE